MGEELEVVVCQRCGRGFVLTVTYREFLDRWGREVVVPVLCPTCFTKTGPLPKWDGEVKWFSSRKHYGFITIEEDAATPPRDVFFHQEQLLHDVQSMPEKGQSVRFHMRHSPKGLEAVNVEIEG
jgi:cold shock CspA family protein